MMKLKRKNEGYNSEAGRLGERENIEGREREMKREREKRNKYENFEVIQR